MRWPVFGMLAALGLVACGTPDPTPSEPVGELPCDVDAVLRDVCQQCHSRPPQDGVPVSFVTYADTQARITVLPDYRNVPAWIVMGDLVGSGMMPQRPVTITQAERETLLAWVDAGAPPAPEGTDCP